MPSVLDASAFLAYLQDEPGADRVADAIAAGATIGSVNLAEVLSFVAATGADPARLVADLTQRRLLGTAVTVVPFSSDDAVEAARLRPLTRAAGLSLADRACLALGRRLGAEVLSADGAWGAVAPDDIELILIR